MDIEQLKLVLELVRGVSEDASTVAVWWLAGHYVLSFASTLVTAVGWVVGLHVVLTGIGRIANHPHRRAE